MLKAILLILALGLAYWYFRGRQAEGGRVSRDLPASTSGSQERMIVCAHCRLHVPESESVTAAGRSYCSEEHCRLGTLNTDT